MLKMSESKDENLDKTITHCRQKLRLCPSWNPHRSDFLSDLANAVLTRFQQLGRIEDLDEATMYHRQVLTLRPAWNPDHSTSVNNLANAVFVRFQRLGRMEDLEEAIKYLRQALALHPPGHLHRSASLSNLASTVYIRFQQLGRMEDLEETITHHRQALALRPPGHPDRSDSLNSLANVVSSCFEQLGRMEDLEEVIVCRRQALAFHPPGHLNHSNSLNNIANTVFTRFEQLGKMEDLEDAITYHRQALTLRPPGHPDRPESLNGLANAVSTRFQHLGRLEDLEEGVTYHHQALTLCPPDHPSHPNSLNNLANAIYTRFDQLGRMEDLEEAITYHHQALALCPLGHPRRSGYLNNLAGTISTRFEQRGRMEDLEEAITYHRQALALCPPGHLDRSNCLHNIAKAVFIRFERVGRMEDQEEVIMFLRQALTIRPPDHPRRSDSLNGFANAVFTRFEQLGRMEDLEEAITYHRQALALRPSGHPQRSTSLDNLAATISTRFRQLGEMEDLEEAITLHRQALALRLPGHPSRSDSLSNLANAVSARFEQLGRMPVEDLEEAITYHCQALDLRPSGHPYRSDSLNNLGGALFTRFRQLGNMGDLDQVIKHLSEARTALPANHPMHVMISSNLASSILMLYDLSPKLDNSLHMVSMAFNLLEGAANHSTASGKARFKVALQWVEEARRRQHHSTVHAYSKSLTLLDRCLIATPTVESQQKFLATTATVPKSLASDAASSAIDAGQLKAAVELLEQGRAILWSKMRGYRHPLEGLRDIDRELADQFEMLSGQLERYAMFSENESTVLSLGSDGVGLAPSISFEAKMQRYRILSERWHDVVGKIRQMDGFADFLQAVPFTTLQMAAAEGPVIIVNVSKYRSDAIILYGIGPPALVPLPSVSPEDLSLLSLQLSHAQAIGSTTKTFSTLRTLWDVIVSPVRDQLATLGVREKTRIWWCPTSELCALPLHAAGPYASGKMNLPDIYISSYTPTLSALIKARFAVVHRTAPPNLLVIGQPDETLPEVKEELHRIQKFGDFVNILVGKGANHQTVLSSLQQHPWAHFACHGHLNKQPFHSSFQLHDNKHLTLLDLIRARLPNAEFAFLSACHSAAGDILGTPDEVIHLAAALQFSGFRSVVGTLWAIADIDGPNIAEDFYGYMFRELGGIGDFRDSAIALNRAIQVMRKRKGMTIDRWINFVHIGA